MWAVAQLKNNGLSDLMSDALAFEISQGLLLKQRSAESCINSIPVTLFPSPFPKFLYDEVLSAQTLINELIFKIPKDPQFIKSSLSNTIKGDEFTKRLYDLYESTIRSGRAQNLSSCICRSDYMMNLSSNENIGDLSIESFALKQVEVNTIASSMSSHSYKTKLMQSYLLKKYDIPLDSCCSFPSNDSCELISNTLISCYDAYGKIGSIILFLVDDIEVNVSDYFQTELNILKNRGDIKVTRKRFKELADDSKTNLGPNCELLVDKKEIAVVYFRTCYDPSHYNFEQAWALREKIERSRAIKCPSIDYHLAGVKKFQETLNNQTQLEKFLSLKDAERLSSLFCKIWSLDTEIGLESAMKFSHNFVLKPQREGGGHNIYRDEISKFVNNIKDNDIQKSKYILMEYINSPREKNWILRSNDGLSSGLEYTSVEPQSLVSELGIYGGILSDNSNLKLSDSAGYLVRSKNYGVDEGGVSMGYAAISNLLLIDTEAKNVNMSRYYHNL